MQHEINRLRARLAGEFGDEDLIQFLSKNKDQDFNLVESLRQSRECVKLCLRTNRPHDILSLPVPCVIDLKLLKRLQPVTQTM
jgi:hypothetical protein